MKKLQIILTVAIAAFTMACCGNAGSKEKCKECCCTECACENCNNGENCAAGCCAECTNCENCACGDCKCNDNCCNTAGCKEKGAIRLNVFVTAAPGHLDEVIAGLNQMAIESQKEDGCIGYDIFRNTLNPGQLVIVETWRDQAALDAHALTPHYTTILPSLEGKREMTLERFEMTHE